MDVRTGSPWVLRPGETVAVIGHEGEFALVARVNPAAKAEREIGTFTSI